jgi:hypothetical protein
VVSRRQRGTGQTPDQLVHHGVRAALLRQLRGLAYAPAGPHPECSVLFECRSQHVIKVMRISQALSAAA